MEHWESPSLLNCLDKTVITINNSSFTIGRSLTCDHIIQSLEVSRFHCVIKKNNNKWVLYDRSSNGTQVNSTKVKFNESIDLSDGDSIKLGTTDDLFFVFANPQPIEKQEVVNPATSSVFPNDEELLEQAASLLAEGLENLQDTPPQPQDIVIEEPSPVIRIVEHKPIHEESSLNLNSQENKSDQNFDIMENELTCSICSELFIKAVTLSCSHTFCKYCIELWKKTKSTCPICRKPIISTAQTLVLDNFIDKIVSTRSEDLKQTRQDIIAQREEATRSAASSSVPSSSTTDGGTDSIIEIYSEDDEDDDDSDLNYLTDQEYDDHDYECYHTGSYRSRTNYYGGYGRCFICNEVGHWANTCPLKRR